MNLDADPAFEAQLDQWLDDLPRETFVSFEAVLAASPGYYPTTLHEAWLRKLAKTGLTPVDASHPLKEVISLPVGHPLDYDWRYAKRTRSDLVRDIESLTRPGGRILYVGTPTLFVAAHAELPDRAHVLVDANQKMIDAVRGQLGVDAAHVVEIGRDEMPSDLRADICVLDPPWYPDATEQFLVAAARCIPIGGLILLSQAPIAARPGVESERVSFGGRLTELGLSLEHADANRLRYEMPHFERMSLMVADPTLRVAHDWRSGDLLRLRKVGDSRYRAPVGRSEKEEWQEVSFGPVRIAVRPSGGDDLGEVERGLDRLTTVSRRDPRRALVGLWTSGNRVRTVKHAKQLVELIRLCDAELGYMTFTHQKVASLVKSIDLNPRVAHELTELLLLEYQEHVAGGYGVVG